LVEWFDHSGIFFDRHQTSHRPTEIFGIGQIGDVDGMDEKNVRRPSRWKTQKWYDVGVGVDFGFAVFDVLDVLVVHCCVFCAFCATVVLTFF